MAWEYKIEYLAYAYEAMCGNFIPNPEAAEQLNKWDAEGWELVAVDAGTFYLRRGAPKWDGKVD